VSKKRTKNARKKVVRKKTLAKKSAERAPSAAPEPVEAEPTAPEPEEMVSLSSVAQRDGAGAIGRMRTGVTPGAGRDGTSLLTKRRSVPELLLWLAGAAVLVWLAWKGFIALSAE